MGFPINSLEFGIGLALTLVTVNVGEGSEEGSDLMVQAEGQEQPLAQCARG